MRLGTLLLRHAAISATQLEAALRNQVLFGGRLGTSLVELGLLDLDLLAAYLGELTGFPVATADLLEDGPGPLRGQLGADLAERLRVVPFGLAGAHGRAVAVAMVDPGDAAARMALATRLGAPVAPYIVPELRALYYLERHFGVARRPRFLRAGEAAAPGPGQEPSAPSEPGAEPGAAPGAERRRASPTGGLDLPPPVTVEPRRRRTSSGVPASGRAGPVLTFAGACERIETATHRDQVAHALLDYARNRFEAMVLFIVRDRVAIGWRGHVLTAAGLRRPIEDLALPLGPASGLEVAYDAARLFVGPSPSPARPVETQLWRAIGAEPDPPGMIVAPVLARGRVINLVYAHGQVAPSAEQAAELEQLALRAQSAYERMLRAVRGG